jgi:hypothetical protein
VVATWSTSLNNLLPFKATHRQLPGAK